MRFRAPPALQEQLDARNLHISSLHQPWTLFVDDARRLTRVAKPGDPWVCQIFYPGDSENFYHAVAMSYGVGPTRDASIEEALRRAEPLCAQMRALGYELDRLAEAVSDRA